MEKYSCKELFNLRALAKIVGIFLFVFLLSFLGYIFPFFNHLIFIIIVAATIYLSWKRLDYGIYILFSELIIGVKGYLFTFNVFGFALSLRIALFLVVILIWFIKKRANKYSFTKSKFFPLYSLFTVILLLGVITALAYGNRISNIFFDINGYLFLALAFPIYDAIGKKRIINLLKIVIAGSLAVSIFSLYCFLEFTIFHQESRPDMAEAISSELSIEDEDIEGLKISHSTKAKNELLEYGPIRNFENQKPPIYRWVTDTSLGQMAYLAGPFFRFFTAGQLYSLIGLAVAITFLVKNKVSGKKALALIVAVNGLALVIGFSRSLWLGLLAVFAYLLFSLPWKKTLKIILYATTILVAVTLITFTLLPSFFDLVSQRINSIIHPTEEASGVNRFNLIQPVLEEIKEHPIFGSGFGTTVEYESVVPEKYGTLRVFAFEWSYLDTILKVGIIGLIIYLLLIFKIFKEGKDIKEKQFSSILISGFLTALFGLAITNITTPFLNHPLGIGFILITILLLSVLKKHE